MTLTEIIGQAAGSMASNSFRSGGKLIQIETTKKYIEVVSTVRTIWTSLLATQFFLFMAAFSLVVLLITLVFMLPITVMAKLMIVASVSFISLAGMLAAFIRFNSESKWLEFSRANEMLVRAVKNRPVR